MGLSAEALESLTNRGVSEVILPSEPEYDRHRRVFNARHNGRPVAIVRCTGAADVVASIEVARAHDVHVTTRAGGHGPTGFAVGDDALLLDLTPMRGVVVNPAARTAVVQGGARWRDVYREAAAFGLVPAGGSCDMVGVAGSTLGGGWGQVSRAFGLACDNLIRAQVVTADAEIRTAGAEDHADLFWALRGGGGGNFGVVTSFEFRLYPLPREVFGGSLTWSYRDAAAVLETYRDQVRAGLPDELYIDVSLYALDDPPLTRQVALSVVYLGAEADGRALLAPFLKVSPPTEDALRMQPYGELLADYAAEIVGGRLQLWKGTFLDAPLPAPTIEAIVAQFAAAPTGACQFFIETLGGAIARVNGSATAYPHRHELMCGTIIGICQDTSALGATDRWTREFRQALAPAATGGAYVNYPDLDLDDWRSAYYRDNYERLVRVKNTYDPDRVFRFAQSIG